MLEAHGDYLQAVEAQQQHDFVRLLVRRSLFARSVVQQIVIGLREGSSRPSLALRQHLEAFYARAVSTTMVEDGFNHMKNDSVLLRRTRRAAPERALAAVVSREVLSRRHHYAELDRDVPLCLVQACLARAGVLFPLLAGPGEHRHAQHHQHEAADTMVVARQRARTVPDRGHRARQAWRADGRLRLSSERLAWRLDALRPPLSCSPARLTWRGHLGLRPRSSRRLVCVALAGSRANVRQGRFDGGLLRPCRPGAQATLVAAVSVEAWEAATFEFHCPAWVAFNHPSLSLPPRLLVVRTCALAPLLCVAASKAFRGMGIGRHMGYQRVVEAPDLFQALTRLVCAVQPELSEEAVLEACAHRTVALSKRASCDGIEDIMVMGDAGEFLDQDDTKTLKKLKEGRAAEQQALHEFKAEVVRRRKALPRGSMRPGERQLAKRRVPQEGGIPHSELKCLPPPPQAPTCGSLGATARGSVGFRLSRSTAERWGTHGERCAAIEVVRVLRTEWSHLNSLPLEDVPIEGLFAPLAQPVVGPDTVRAPNGEGASSSSRQPASKATAEAPAVANSSAAPKAARKAPASRRKSST